MQLEDKVENMKVGIVGFGSIGFDVGNRIDQGIENFKLVGVSSKTKEKVLKKISSFKNKPPFLNLDELCKRSDVILDCAPKKAFKSVLQNCLLNKTKLITISGSGILENFELVKNANQSKIQVVLASGAILGLDGLRAASEGTIYSVKMITTKPPNALASAKYVLENKITLENLSEKKLIFNGSAKDGAEAFPANVNVAAAIGLAGIGPEKTNLEIWADPSLTKNTHQVFVKSDSSDFEIKVQNIQSKENPGTGKITSLSMIACLRGLVSSLKTGT